jgi:hypothetical protein
MLLKWWWDYSELNLLPYPGSMGEQPWFVVQAISKCKEAVNEIEAEQTAHAAHAASAAHVAKDKSG